MAVCQPNRMFARRPMAKHARSRRWLAPCRRPNFRRRSTHRLAACTVSVNELGFPGDRLLRRFRDRGSVPRAAIRKNEAHPIRHIESCSAQARHAQRRSRTPRSPSAPREPLGSPPRGSQGIPLHPGQRPMEDCFPLDAEWPGARQAHRLPLTQEGEAHAAQEPSPQPPGRDPAP